jgi:hypothetical protein
MMRKVCFVRQHTGLISTFQVKVERTALPHVIQSQLPADLLQLTIDPVSNYEGSITHLMQSTYLEYTKIDRVR